MSTFSLFQNLANISKATPHNDSQLEIMYGVDRRVYSGIDAVAYVTLPNKETRKLGTLSLVSISTHRDKFPVSQLGKVSPSGFTLGHRTIGGTMVFATLDRTVWEDFMTIWEYSRGTKFPRDLKRGHPDDLPPFDVVITFANEYGNTSFMGLSGVTILDQGQTFGVDNIEVMETYAYMALEIIPMQANSTDIVGAGSSTVVATPTASSSPTPVSGPCGQMPIDGWTQRVFVKDKVSGADICGIPITALVAGATVPSAPGGVTFTHTTDTTETYTISGSGLDCATSLIPYSSNGDSISTTVCENVTFLLDAPAGCVAPVNQNVRVIDGSGNDICGVTITANGIDVSPPTRMSQAGGVMFTWNSVGIKSYTLSGTGSLCNGGDGTWEPNNSASIDVCKPLIMTANNKVTFSQAVIVRGQVGTNEGGPILTPLAGVPITAINADSLTGANPKQSSCSGTNFNYANAGSKTYTIPVVSSTRCDNHGAYPTKVESVTAPITQAIVYIDILS